MVFKYGYGLTPAIADLAFTSFTPDLLITVDNGISSHDGVKQAQDHGMQVIITDHHLTTKPTPSAQAVVNPNQLGCDFPSKALAGVGVAFYVLANLSTYRKKLNKSSAIMSQYLDLVALGTYADVASLDYNNRILVDVGLKRIQQHLCRPGISALLEIAGREAVTLKAQDLGFVLGPRINAAGRMETMDIGIECLLAQDFASAYPLAEQLNQLNVERRQVEATMKQEALLALDQIQLDDTVLPEALIMFEPHWHQGVIGIVAGRLKEQFHRPSIVFAADEDGVHIKGSARSIEGVHIRDAIECVAEHYPHLVSHFGGHAAAAGLTIQKVHFEEFKQAFEVLMAAQDEGLFTATLWTDGELAAENIQDHANNMTRFVVVDQEDHAPTGNDKTSAVLCLSKDKPGGLYEILGEFASERINLTKIESRPSKEKLGSYIFFVDMEGHHRDIKIMNVINRIQSKVGYIKILGSYPQEGDD